jgi:O-antigen/teichoic acid export membrane protein
VTSASSDRSVAITFATNIALAILGATTGLLAARLLGLAGRGQLAAIQTFPTVLAVLAMLGLPDALVYFTARDPARAGRYLATVMILVMPVCLVAMTIGYLAMPLLLAAQSQDTVDAARHYLLLLPLFALAGMPFHPLRGQGQFRLWNALRLGPGLAWAVVLVLAAVGHGTTAAELAGHYLLGLAIVAVIVMTVVSRHIAPPYRPSRTHAPALLRFGAPGLLATLPNVLSLRLDQLLMGALLGPEPLGLYTVAVAWSAATGPLLSTVGAVAFPRVASEKDTLSRVALVGRSSRMAVLLGILSLPPLLIATPVAVTLLFGESFRGAIPAALLLTVATTVFSFGHVVEEILRGLGLPGDALRAELTGLAVTALSLLVLLPLGGIEGAAMASLLGYSAIAAVALARTARATGATISDLVRPRGTDLSALTSRLRSAVTRKDRETDHRDEERVDVA